MERNSNWPSVEPMYVLVARSGWGIMPSTLRSRLSTPAMLRMEPLGLFTYRKATRSSASSSSSVCGSAW